jgi:hypothetical protein
MDSGFELVTPDEVVIAGLPSADMTIRAGGRALGRLRGFVIERSHHRIRYLLVRASGLSGKSTLVPFADPRIDVDTRTIELDMNDRDLWQFRNFTPEHLLPA